jgi:hypothetical protein
MHRSLAYGPRWRGVCSRATDSLLLFGRMRRRMNGRRIAGRAVSRRSECHAARATRDADRLAFTLLHSRNANHKATPASIRTPARHKTILRNCGGLRTKLWGHDQGQPRWQSRAREASAPQTTLLVCSSGLKGAMRNERRAEQTWQRNSGQPGEERLSALRAKRPHDGAAASLTERSDTWGERWRAEVAMIGGYGSTAPVATRRSKRRSRPRKISRSERLQFGPISPWNAPGWWGARVPGEESREGTAMPGVESERMQQVHKRLEDPRTRAWVNAIAYAARNPQISVEGTEMAIFELIQWIVDG